MGSQAQAAIDPAAFADAEVIKAKLDAVLEGQARINGRLEAISAQLDSLAPAPAMRQI